MTITQPATGARQHERPEPGPLGAEEKLIRQELHRLIQEQQQHAGAYSEATAELWEQIEAALQGGKLTRPGLVHLGYRAYDGEEAHRVLALGCAFELLHTALLMHDDVIDRDFVRRARPTLSAHYRDRALEAGNSKSQAEHAGGSAAIIAGDLLLTLAIAQAARSAAGLESQEAVTAAFNLAVAQAGAGELEDLLYSLHPTPANTAQVLRMEELKTAGYSFQLPLVCGALLAGASQDQANDLGQIGCRFGVAYQITDDILGSFGDPQTTGKSVVSDLREGKSTVLTALASEDTQFRQSLAQFRDGTLCLEELRGALQHTGAKDFARQLAAQLCTSAVKSEQFRTLPEAVRQELLRYPEFILDRNL